MSYQRVEHPEIKLHQFFIKNLTLLENNLKTSQADQGDMLFNFISQFLRVTTGSFDEPFKTMVSKAVYSTEEDIDTRNIAAKIVKSIDYLEWPDRLLGRIYLSDIRNQIVFILWKDHQHVIPAQWTPQTQTQGTEEQNASYIKAAHCIGGKILDPKDSERLLKLLKWMHFLKLVFHIKEYLNTDESSDEYDAGDNLFTFNTFSGGCLHKYNTEGMEKLIWELFLDIYTYDNVG
jgi:hypothetical protein